MISDLNRRNRSRDEKEGRILEIVPKGSERFRWWVKAYTREITIELNKGIELRR